MTVNVATPRLIAASVATSNTVALKGKHLLVDASGGPVTIALPADAGAGIELSIEKIDGTANAVVVSGTIRGASSTISITTQYGSLEFLAAADHSWRPVANHRSDASLSAAFAARLEAATYTYNADGTVATETAGGFTTTYAYNADGSVHTATRNGVTMTYTYDASGNVTAVA